MAIRRSFWLAATFLTVSMSSLSAGAQKASPTGPAGIVVRVYNYARINTYTLERTQRRVSEIFIKAGFQIDWIHCARCEEEKSQYPECADLIGPSDLVLKIMPRIDMEKNGFKKEAFGLTTGRTIMISTERLYDIAEKSEQTRDRILALAVAHEMGHALSGSTSHSSRGIMRPRWYSGDLQLESRHSAGFTEEQIDRMHRNWMAAQDADRPGGTVRAARIQER